MEEENNSFSDEENTSFDKTKENYAWYVYQQINRVARVGSELNPLIKEEVYKYECAVQQLEVLLAPYLKDEYYEKIKELDEEFGNPQANDLRTREDYYLRTVARGKALIKVLDEYGILLKRRRIIEIGKEPIIPETAKPKKPKPKKRKENPKKKKKK